MIDDKDLEAFASFMQRVDRVIDRASGGIGFTHADFADAQWAALFYDLACEDPEGCTDQDIIEHLAEYDTVFAMNVDATNYLAEAGDVAVLPS